mmetsp:Transcript_36924/g.50899  ORF Transcript_36924/g.50899 Transcript_36924/m.50899 type:complete len:128 (-) Transcript_36924:23-406(-)
MEERIVVTGAGPFEREETPTRRTCNGTYLKEETLFNEKYWYSRYFDDGRKWEGVIYFENDPPSWKINFKNSKSGWCFSQVPEDTASLSPPSGHWVQSRSSGNDYPDDIDYSHLYLQEDCVNVKPAKR